MKIYKDTDKEFYIDGYLNTNLETAKKAVSNDWDMMFVVDGYEGTGKSVLAQQVALKVDPTFNINRIVFTPKSFKQTVLSAQKRQAVVYDEAYHGLSSRGAMGTINKTLIKMLTEIRYRNLFILIVLPTVFILDKYVGIWRSRALLHVYSPEKFQRGFFAFYNIDKKKELYMHGKQFYSYKTPKPNFIGRFTNHYTVDKEEYKAKKRKETSLIEDELDKREDKHFERNQICHRMKRNGYNHTEIAKCVGMTSARVGQILKETDYFNPKENKLQEILGKSA